MPWSDSAWATASQTCSLVVSFVNFGLFFKMAFNKSVPLVPGTAFKTLFSSVCLGLFAR